MATKRVIITRRPYTTSLSRASVGVENFTPKPALQDPPTPTPSLKGGWGGGLHAAGRDRAHAPMRESGDVVGDILATASQLTAKQRQELLDQLSLANKMTRASDNDRDLDMWATAVHAALTDRVTASDGSAYGRLLVKQSLASTQNWRPMQEFMEQSRLNELKVVERASVYHMLADLLVDHARSVAQRSGAPLGPKLVGNCTHAMAGVFDQAFPGYLRAGLAKIAARQLVRGTA